MPILIRYCQRSHVFQQHHSRVFQCHFHTQFISTCIQLIFIRHFRFKQIFTFCWPFPLLINFIKITIPTGHRNFCLCCFSIFQYFCSNTFRQHRNNIIERYLVHFCKLKFTIDQCFLLIVPLPGHNLLSDLQILFQFYFIFIFLFCIRRRCFLNIINQFFVFMNIFVLIIFLSIRICSLLIFLGIFRF